MLTRRCGMCSRRRWLQRLAQLADELRAENARLREELARRDAELERVNAELAVLQRLVFGRSSERARPDAPGGSGATAAKTVTPPATVATAVTDPCWHLA